MPEHALGEIERLLASMEKIGASDLHLKIGSPPIYRIHGVAQRVKAEQVVDSGSAGQIIKLLGQFKDFVAEKDKPKEKTPEDIWAEDAASSIRSSSPLKLPTRAPGSDDDEYKRAFNEA